MGVFAGGFWGDFAILGAGLDVTTGLAGFASSFAVLVSSDFDFSFVSFACFAGFAGFAGLGSLGSFLRSLPSFAGLDSFSSDFSTFCFFGDSSVILSTGRFLFPDLISSMQVVANMLASSQSFNHLLAG